jgi:hypothetical protein
MNMIRATSARINFDNKLVPDSSILLLVETVMIKLGSYVLPTTK